MNIDDIVETSSGNVFADLGMPDPETHLIKAGIVYQIARLLKERGLTQTEAARMFGVPQPRISALLRGNFRDISEARLLECLTALGQDIEIRIKPAGSDHGRIMVAYG